MRQKYLILLIAIVSQTAGAHVLDGQEELPTRLVHQLAGLHHLPVTLVVIAIGILVVRGWRTKSGSR